MPFFVCSIVHEIKIQCGAIARIVLFYGLVRTAATATVTARVNVYIETVSATLFSPHFWVVIGFVVWHSSTTPPSRV